MAACQCPSNSPVDAPTTSAFRCNEGLPLASLGRGGTNVSGGDIVNENAISAPAAAPTPADVSVALMISREPQKISQRSPAANGQCS